MALLAAMFGPAASVGDHDSWLIRAIGGGRTKAGVPVSEWTALQLPVVYSAVGLIADTIAQLPLNLMKKRADGRGADVASDEPLQQILHDGSLDDMAVSSFTWRNTTQHHILLWGNGYSEIEQNGRGETAGIWPLLPDRTRPERSSGRLAYRTTIDGRQLELPSDRVLHVPALGFDGFVGYSPLAIARQAIGLGLAMEEFGAKFFANDAKSGGFLLHPGKLGPQAQGNLRAPNGDKIPNPADPGSRLAAQGGIENAHRIKVLEEGMKFVSTTIPPEDAQFLGSREFQIAEIARIYRVPLILLSSQEKTTSFGAGIEQLIIAFVVLTIQPWVVRWEQELNRKLLTKAQRAAGYFIKFNVNALLRGDMKARAAFYEALTRCGAIVPNEIRELEDWNPREGGDEPHSMPGAGQAGATPGNGNAPTLPEDT